MAQFLAIVHLPEEQCNRLIFLSSIAAQTGGVIGSYYAASKTGLLGLMHSYASLLARDGITSNAIARADRHGYVTGQTIGVNSGRYLS